MGDKRRCHHISGLIDFEQNTNAALKQSKTYSKKCFKKCWFTQTKVLKLRVALFMIQILPSTDIQKGTCVCFTASLQSARVPLAVHPSIWLAVFQAQSRFAAQIWGNSDEKDEIRLSILNYYLILPMQRLIAGAENRFYAKSMCLPCHLFVYLSICHMVDIFLTHRRTSKTLLTAENVKEIS